MEFYEECEIENEKGKHNPTSSNVEEEATQRQKKKGKGIVLNLRIADCNLDSDGLKEFYFPDYILAPDSKPEDVHEVPTCLVVVFMNSKSGGQLGGELLVTYRSFLNNNQQSLSKCMNLGRLLQLAESFK
ncbi:hypothetical protein Dimus_019783 [Dionaea muscipula]